jgi:hypothetical protein
MLPGTEHHSEARLISAWPVHVKNERVSLNPEEGVQVTVRGQVSLRGSNNLLLARTASSLNSSISTCSALDACISGACEVESNEST